MRLADDIDRLPIGDEIRARTGFLRVVDCCQSRAEGCRSWWEAREASTTGISTVKVVVTQGMATTKDQTVAPTVGSTKSLARRQRVAGGQPQILPAATRLKYQVERPTGVVNA